MEECHASVDEILCPLIVTDLLDCFVWIEVLELLEDGLKVAFLSVCIHWPCLSLQLFYES